MDDDFYNASRMQNISAVKKSDVMRSSQKEEAKKRRLYRPGSDNENKNDGTKQPRLCAAPYNDQKHGLFITTPTMRRVSFRRFASGTAPNKLSVHARVVIRAFLRSKTSFCRRPVFTRSSSQMALHTDNVIDYIYQYSGCPKLRKID